MVTLLKAKDSTLRMTHKSSTNGHDKQYHLTLWMTVTGVLSEVVCCLLCPTSQFICVFPHFFPTAALNDH
jgi:hypothetical protein